MTRDVDVAIAGGGHAGLLAANWLKTLGLQVLVVDPDLRPSPASGRTLALLGGSQRAIAQIGLWPGLAPFGTLVRHVDVADGESRGQVRYRASDIAVDSLAYGFRQWELRNALLAQLPEADTMQDKIVDWTGTTHGLRLVCENGGEIKARLLIGADGRRSTIRAKAGIGVETTRFDQTAWSFTLRHERPHRHTVIERMSTQGPLAVLPVGERECGITWVRASDSTRLDADAMVSGVNRLIDGALGELRLASAIDHYPLSAQHAARYVAPRLALIGDAAHGAHPIHAQGFNMGVADIAALADVLAHAGRRGEDIGGACLRRYEKRRRGDNRARLRMTGALNRLFSNDVAALMPVRRVLLDGLSTFAPLRQRAIRHGMRLQD